jgi:myo-inositol 2-dehydrogenase / D-chiro-inositol 1-dehydrogenase
MAHTPEDALAIAQAAEAHPHLVCLVGHCERFNRAYLDARRAVDEGRVGTPRFAWASRLSPLHLNDPVWQLGTLDTAVHDIDVLLWLVGDRPVAVAAQGTTVNPELPIPDQVTYQIRFASGALAQGHIGWVPFSGGYPMRGNAHPRLFLAGTGGTLSLDLWQRPVAVDSQASGAYFWPDDVLVGYGEYFTEVTAQDYAFLQAISTGRPLPIRPREAWQAVQVAHAAHESLTRHNGLPVPLSS